MTKFISNYIRDLVYMSDDIISEFLKDNEGDLLWESNKRSGGQVVGWGDQTIHLTHIPTGVKVSCWEDRSQHTNRQICVIRLMLEINKKECQ